VLVSALVKIANAAHQIPKMEAERNPATAHMPCAYTENPCASDRNKPVKTKAIFFITAMSMAQVVLAGRSP
jgi:hypothetical protein